ncbi:TolC family protein [Pseudogemmatithrix spongiicola]|uniref:TolC family protein n=1 Tax=Pseudogemmatithrix spongiicola TaxID=3062599 RepID=A0AA49JX40_9BACT|nr:TolC family protein [Gemmatimonadaceae bacterium 'strain 138']WKW13765.1 TolC family protein [Gemmatimonadaceae bacterium 'strain 318']
MQSLTFRGALRWVAAVAVFAQPLGAQQASDTLRLTVEDAVARVLRASDESRIADAQLELADAAVLSARAAGLPQLRLSGSNQQVLKNARAAIVGAVFNQNYVYTANLNLQQAVFQGGRVFAAAQAASRAEQAAALTRDETRAQLAVQIQAVYLNAVFTARIAEIQATNRQLAEERVTQAEQLERAGRASRYDVLRARVERDNLEPELRAAVAARTLADLELRRLLDLPATQPVALVTALDGERVRTLATTADAGPASERAAVRAAELTAAARRAGIRVARADLLPTFTAGFTYGYLAFPTSPGIPTVLGDRGNEFCPPGAPPAQQCQNSGWFPDRNFSIQMSWPLFDGLRAKGQIDLAQAQARIAELQARQARESASIEVEQARAELARAQAVASARETTVREAQEAFELATLRLARGVGTQLEVSDAQLALLRARTTDARAVFDLYLAVAELARVRAEPIPLPDGGSVSIRPTH